MIPEPFDSQDKRAGFAALLLRWFAKAMRPLPWRGEYDPYGVWISEIMLQQTQMERGVRYFNEWMRRFPDVRSVAVAGADEILAAWEGLGYYSRARNLHAAARAIVHDHGGVFPDSLAAIRALPGVGEYTAAAIASIAFNIPEPAVDANVLRIFSRLLDLDAPVGGKEPKAEITAVVRSLMPADSSRLFNQALMEFGALVCGKNPRCAECPAAAFCRALRNGTVPLRPVKAGKTAYRQIEIVAAVIVKDGRVFIRKRPLGGLWPGLWEFPDGAVEEGESPEQALLRHLREEAGFAVSIVKKIGTVRHGYTTNRVTMHGYVCDAESGGGFGSGPGDSEKWILPADFPAHSFAAGHRKLLEKMGWK